MHQLEFFLKALPLELFRLSVWLLLLAVIFVPLERLFAGHRQKVLRAFALSDIGYYFLNNFAPKLFMVPVMGLIGWGLHFLVPQGVYAFSGSLPLVVRLLAGLVVGDIGYYWCHRAMHEIPLLWRFHALHHGAEEIDWLVSTRAHPVDVAFGHTAGLIPLYALGLAQPLGGQSDPVTQWFIVIGTIWSFFIHANLNWRFGPLEWLVSTPAFHHWHHTKSGPINRNYASMVPALDLVFGTYHLPGRLPGDYGIETPLPTDMAGQLLEPFAGR